MLERVQSFIAAEQLFTQADRLLIAVSGGVDSMVLLHAMHTLGYACSVVHCNFQLRGEASDEDAAFVRDHAEKLGLPYYERVLNPNGFPGKSIQMAARMQRYLAFETIAQRDGKLILTAHHLDDRLETFWINFARAAGWRGLSSLQAKPRKSWTAATTQQEGEALQDEVAYTKIRRPLLCVARQDILTYQKEHNIPFREDSSNATDKYQRNRFRHHVLPELYAWEPQLGQRAAANFQRMEEMLALYDEQIANYKAQWFIRQDKHWFTPREPLLNHPQANTLAWEFWSIYGFNAEQIRQALTAKIGSIITTERMELLVQTEGWLLRQKEREKAETATYDWPAEQRTLALSTLVLTREPLPEVPQQFTPDPNCIVVDGQRLLFPLQVRRWKAGDQFCPLGMDGQHQSLQDFFTNNKINRWERAQQWLLVNGDGVIIWIIGQRLDERFKVTQATSQTVQFKVNH
ncbi:MAG: tRNA lysidine(34) synthetase TilS [Bacteroidota bacterium]